MKNKGFTLVEMAIVIVVIGLIVTAITAGREAIRNAELKSVIKDINGYKVAIRGFEMQYNSLPGDLSNAASYWASTANGNGDGNVSTSTTEGLRAWQQLSLATFLPTNYTGVTSGGKFVIDVNIPSSHLTDKGFRYDYQTQYGRSANVFQLVGKRSSDNDMLGAAITPVEAKSIDQKIDNGLPDTGNIVARDGDGVTGCVDTDGVIGATYTLSDNDIKCKIYFGF